MNTNIIDTTYFTGPIVLTGMNTAPVRASVKEMITYYQPLFLRAVLGETLGGAFIRALELSSTAGSTAGFDAGFDEGFEVGTPAVSDASRFNYIRDGITYPYAGGTVRWNGLGNKNKSSALANFVYYQCRLATDTQTGTVGEVRAVSENADGASPTAKMVRAWNEMVDQNRILYGMVSTLIQYPAATLEQPMPEGFLVYPELVASECNPNMFTYINAFNI